MPKVISGDQYNLVATKDVTLKQFFTWAKVESIDVLVYFYLGTDRCGDF